MCIVVFFFFFKQKTAYEMRISDWSSDVCSSDLVAFDASTVLKSLAEKNSKLQEKQRELDRLQLELAERERSSHLETEKARAELEKAARKTEQPQELIAGIEYRKLVVARKQAERKLALARELESANAEQRAQELRLVRSEIDRKSTRLNSSH